MKKLIALAGLSAGLAIANFAAFTPASHAGWGPPFACGAGQNTAKINWGDHEVPGETKAAVTGVLSTGDSEKESDWSDWSIEELENGKPLLVYHFVAGLTDPTNDNYDLSQAFEVKVLTKDDIVEEINEEWRAVKSPLDGEGDPDKLENQARVEFYAFTGEKMGDITVKDRLSSRKMKVSLKQYAKKNRKYVRAEIKRLEKEAKEQARND